MRIRDAFIASVKVTRCVCRTPISSYFSSPASKPLKPGEGRAAAKSERWLIWYTLGFHHLVPTLVWLLFVQKKTGALTHLFKTWKDEDEGTFFAEYMKPDIVR
jgi:hypothetical protein